jgi:hypothetical protein
MDRVSPFQKLKKMLKGKTGVALGVVAVAAIALTVGLRVGRHEDPAHAQTAHEPERSHAEEVAMHGHGQHAAQ